MLARTSLVAFSALLLSNTVACGLGAEPKEPSHLDPPSPASAEPARGEESGQESSGLPDEEPLPGMPAPEENETTTPVGATPACDLAKPFGELEALPFDTTAYETGGRLSADELTFYFSRKVGLGNMQPFIATRASKDDAWGEPSVIASVDSQADDGYLTTTKDELVGFFASTRSGNLQIHRASRAARSDAWTGISLVQSVGTASSEDDPFLVPNGSAIYFDSDRNGTPTVYRAAIDASGNVATPTVVMIGTNAVVTGDELTMYLSRGAQSDIYVSKRAKVTDPWGKAASVTELFSAAIERVTWVSEDGCRVIVASNRTGGAGSSDLYFATKPK